MDTNIEPVSKPDGKSERKEAADFHTDLIRQEAVIDARLESENRPEGNYEYEQMVAERADFNPKQLIEEAAFFIAQERGFVPGNEMADWLQAEAYVEGMLRHSQSPCLNK